MNPELNTPHNLRALLTGLGYAANVIDAAVASAEAVHQVTYSSVFLFFSLCLTHQNRSLF